MNQILLTNNLNNKKNNKYSGNNSGDMKKIIMFFGIAILVFAILIIGVYAYKLSSKEKEEVINPPELSLEETESEVKIIAKADAGINKIIYTWNDEEPKEVEMNGRTNHEEALEIPEGESKLKIVVIDQNGEEIETSKEFFREEDKDKPKIEIDETIGNGKVKIKAVDENNKLKQISYQWNDEEPVVIKAEDENQTTIETTIDVKRGKNTLVITATNSLDKEEKLDKIFNGVNKPVIEVTREGNRLYMRMTHDMGFKKIQFTVNGQEYVYDENFYKYDAEKQEVAYQFELKEGENIVIIHAISTEDTEEIYRGKCVYNKEQ